MVDTETAISYAKELSEYCKGQFCPECIFNQGTCLLGEFDWLPKYWNTKDVLDYIKEHQKDLQKSV